MLFGSNLLGPRLEEPLLEQGAKIFDKVEKPAELMEHKQSTL